MVRNEATSIHERGRNAQEWPDLVCAISERHGFMPRADGVVRKNCQDRGTELRLPNLNRNDQTNLLNATQHTSETQGIARIRKVCQRSIKWNGANNPPTPNVELNGTGVIHESVMGTDDGQPIRLAKCTTVQAPGSLPNKTFERMHSIAGVHGTKCMLEGP